MDTVFFRDDGFQERFWEGNKKQPFYRKLLSEGYKLMLDQMYKRKREIENEGSDKSRTKNKRKTT